MHPSSKKCNSSLSYSLTRHSCHKMNSLPLALHFIFAWNYCFQNLKKRIVALKKMLCNWQKVTKGLLRKAARHIVQNSTINHLITKECNTNGQDIWLCLASTEMVLKFNMIFYDSTPKKYFQNINIKLNLNDWMTLKSSIMIFEALKPLQPQ